MSAQKLSDELHPKFKPIFVSSAFTTLTGFEMPDKNEQENDLLCSIDKLIFYRLENNSDEERLERPPTL